MKNGRLWVQRTSTEHSPEMLRFIMMVSTILFVWELINLMQMIQIIISLNSLRFKYSIIWHLHNDAYTPGGGCVSLGHRARRHHWTSHWLVLQGLQKHQSPGWWPATKLHSSGTGWHSQLTSLCEAAGRSSAGCGRTTWSHPYCSEWESGTGCSWRIHCLWRWPLTPPALRGEEKHLR